jgi:hypothetical protein
MIEEVPSFCTKPLVARPPNGKSGIPQAQARDVLASPTLVISISSTRSKQFRREKNQSEPIGKQCDRSMRMLRPEHAILEITC